jgi:sec-independent protein translocase protein TatA
MNTQSLAFLQNLSSWEIVLIFLVVLLFFGAKRLPELFRSLGKSIKEFKNATSGIEEDIRSAMDADDAPKAEPKADSKQVEAEEAPKTDKKA